MAIEAIAASPAAMDEAAAILPLLEREAKEPAGPEGVFHVVGRRFALYAQPERSGDEAVAWWSDYYDALSDVPLGSLEAAMIAWVKTAAEFLPKPGQLLALTAEHYGKEALACFRIKAAMRHQPASETATPGEPERQPPSDEERAKVKAMLNDFRAKLPEKKVPLGPRANSAKVDERGVSPELRALVEQQRANS